MAQWDFREVAALASSQHGVVTRQQLYGLGVNARQLDHRVKTGEWARILPRVFRITAVPEDFRQRSWAAALWAGSSAALSHQCAGYLWGFISKEPAQIELTASVRRHSTVPWLRVHCAPLPKNARRVRTGLAVTSPSRTLVDLASALSLPELENTIEAAFRRQLSTPLELRRALRDVGKHGKKGTGHIHLVLRSGARDAAAQSELEDRALRLFRRHGLPRPLCQYRVLHQQHLLATVDFAWPAQRVIVEADSFEHHSGRVAWEKDLARYNALTFAGWTVTRLTWADVISNETPFVTGLRRQLEPT